MLVATNSRTVRAFMGIRNAIRAIRAIKATMSIRVIGVITAKTYIIMAISDNINIICNLID